MAKRFIDTEIFDDPWFMDLNKDCKLLWLYLITKCDHAGIISINKRLIQFQTGIKDLNISIKELGNRLVRVREDLIFIPKFLEFQYPNFPQSNVRQQQSAISILEKYKLYSNGLITLNKELDNTYEHDNDNDNDNESEKENSDFENFWNQYHSITKLPKTDMQAALKYWNKLKASEQKKAIENIKEYYHSVDPKYIKKARTYLADKNFNDEFKNIKKDTGPYKKIEIDY